MNDGTVRAYIGTEDEMQFVVSTSIDPSEPTGLISEPEYQGQGTGKIDAGLELCMASIDVLDARPSNIMFQYYLVNQETDEALYGDVFLTIPVK